MHALIALQMTKQFSGDFMVPTAESLMLIVAMFAIGCLVVRTNRLNLNPQQWHTGLVKFKTPSYRESGRWGFSYLRILSTTLKCSGTFAKSTTLANESVGNVINNFISSSTENHSQMQSLSGLENSVGAIIRTNPCTVRSLKHSQLQM